MAFFLLGMGLAMGATAVALSEAERDRYYVSRSMYDYLGNKDGADIFRDRVTGEYYSDDGFEVRRYGKPGFRPHPINRERLKGLMSKYNPDNVRWVDFLLAMYCGNEQKLWENINNKYEMPPEPKEPTWGKGIRKERWARYEQEKAEYEQKAALAKIEFRKECEYWDGKLAAYMQEHQGKSGRNLLQRALSGQGNVIAVITTTSAPQPTNAQTFQAKVPEGLRAGDQFTVSAGGSLISVKVPPGAAPGALIQFSVPVTPAVSAAVPIVQTAANPPSSRESSIPVATYAAPSTTSSSSSAAPNKPTTTAAATSKPPATTSTTTSNTARPTPPPIYPPVKQSSFRTANSLDGGWAPAESDLYASAVPTATTYDEPPPAIGASSTSNSSSLSSPPPAIGAPTPSKTYNQNW